MVESYLNMIFHYGTSGVDDLLAKHIAYLFIRDPLVLYESSLEQDPQSDTDHYEVLVINVYGQF